VRSGLRLAVLASGAGTNLQAILDTVHGHDGIELVAVAGDEPAAPALERARAAGVEVEVFPHDSFPDRAAHDGAMPQVESIQVQIDTIPVHGGAA